MEFPAIDPVALQLGPIAIRWYALAYLTGFVFGWAYASRLAYPIDKGRPHKTDIDDFLVWAIPAVIIGGRLGYVLFYNFEHYALYPLDALKVWQGGMSFHGGAAGLGVAMIVYAKRHSFPVFSLSDLICCVAPIGLFFGRIANFVNGELYGRVTEVSWGIVFPGTDGQPRHPSQLYEAMLEGLVIFLILRALTKRGIHKQYPGLVTGLFVFLYGVFRFAVEYVREPDAHLGLISEFLSMGQILCIPMILLGAGIIIYAMRAKHETTKNG